MSGVTGLAQLLLLLLLVDVSAAAPTSACVNYKDYPLAVLTSSRIFVNIAKVNSSGISTDICMLPPSADCPLHFNVLSNVVDDGVGRQMNVLDIRNAADVRISPDISPTATEPLKRLCSEVTERWQWNPELDGDYLCHVGVEWPENANERASMACYYPNVTAFVSSLFPSRRANVSVTPCSARRQHGLAVFVQFSTYFCNKKKMTQI